jgi:hypothetical protein
MLMAVETKGAGNNSHVPYWIKTWTLISSIIVAWVTINLKHYIETKRLTHKSRKDAGYCLLR